MGLTMKERKAVTREVAKRYQGASKPKRGAMLEEFTTLTGYHRTYAQAGYLRTLAGRYT
jgi:hypothetical protein